MTDFERGLRNSLFSAFPSATIDGCLFHFCQAILKWVRKNGLKNAYEEGSVIRSQGGIFQVKSGCRYKDSHIWRFYQSMMWLPRSSFSVVRSLCSLVLMTFLHTSQAPGCKDLPLEGVHVSLLSHGTFWTGLHVTSTERTTTLKLGRSSLLCRLDMLIQQSGISWLQSTLNSPLLTRSSFSKAMETSLPEERNAM